MHYTIYINDMPWVDLDQFKIWPKLLFVLRLGPYIRLAFTEPFVLWFVSRGKVIVRANLNNQCQYKYKLSKILAFKKACLTISNKFKGLKVIEKQ